MTRHLSDEIWPWIACMMCEWLCMLQLKQQTWLKHAHLFVCKQLIKNLQPCNCISGNDSHGWFQFCKVLFWSVTVCLGSQGVTVGLSFLFCTAPLLFYFSTPFLLPPLLHPSFLWPLSKVFLCLCSSLSVHVFLFLCCFMWQRGNTASFSPAGLSLLLQEAKVSVPFPVTSLWLHLPLLMSPWLFYSLVFVKELFKCKERYVPLSCAAVGLS